MSLKLKSHSGAKKRVKMKGKHKMFLQKSAKKHLLTHKSKRQKKLNKRGMPLSQTRTHDFQRLLPFYKS